MGNGIQEGDIVKVYWENVEAEHDLRVLHIPTATGDSWICERMDGTPIYIQMFCKMIKHVTWEDTPF